jgi:hypothetical protein
MLSQLATFGNINGAVISNVLNNRKPSSNDDENQPKIMSQVGMNWG